MKHCSFFKGLSVANFNSAWPRLQVQGNASYPRMNEFYYVPSLASFTAAGFICCLLVNTRPASQEAVIGKNLSYIDLFGFFVFNFFWLNFTLIETCPKSMYIYLCSFSLRRSASRLSHDIVSPHCTSWKRGKQRKRSW